MFRSEYTNEREAWQATVAKASLIAERPLHLKRDYLPNERRKVESLLAEAETVLGLIGIPRDPADLVAYVRSESAKTATPETPAAPTHSEPAANDVASSSEEHGKPPLVLMGASGLAKKYGVPRDTLAKRLDRWQANRDGVCFELKHRTPHMPKYVYDEAAAMEVIDRLRSDEERPPGVRPNSAE